MDTGNRAGYVRTVTLANTQLMAYGGGAAPAWDALAEDLMREDQGMTLADAR